GRRGAGALGPGAAGSDTAIAGRRCRFHPGGAPDRQPYPPRRLARGHGDGVGIMTGKPILSIGEAMVELSPSGQDGLWRLGIAGDTLNTAWYLRRLLPADWRVAYCSRVGLGEFSQQMVDFLAAEGIDATHVTRDPQREIALYAISLKDGERSFSYWRDT